jgi:uncharacterized protein YkwD
VVGKVLQSVAIETKRNRKYRGQPQDYRAAQRIADECGDLWGSWRATVWIALIIVICIVFVESAPFAAEQRARTPNKPAQKEDSLNEEHIRSMESNIVRFTNKYREKAKLQPLKISPALTFLARKQNEHMCANGTLSHESKLFPEGWRKLSDRMQAVRIRSSGENVAYSTIGKDPEQWADFIVKGWMKSRGHRKNILNAKFNFLGVAVWECGGRIAYATQVFSSDIGRIPRGTDN